MNQYVDINELRVGLFIHLDLGWMSHPFPLSSFKLTTEDQIATVRALGLTRVRWSPEKSDPVGKPALDTAVPSEAVSALAESAQDMARRLEREALQAQRSALHVCEQQYGEAARALRSASEAVKTNPSLARERCEALSSALLGKMLVDGDMCIRLLTESAGDRASAHALNVTVISLLLGRLLGFNSAEMTDLGMGAMLHDVGKCELPDRVRHLQEGFTTAETALYREHVGYSVALGRKMGLNAGTLMVLAQHHEHADGSGFPQRMVGDRMTPAARIVALVNRYDNLCNPSVATWALTPHEALSMMFAQGKSKFDATILNGFIRMMGVYPPGSVVQLTDDRYAMVSSVNSTRPLKPTVLVFDPRVAREDALFLDLEATQGATGIRRSVKPAQLPKAALDYLAPGARVTYFFEPVALQQSMQHEEVAA